MLHGLKNYWFNPEFNRRRKFLQRVPFFKGVPRYEFGRLFQSLVAREYMEGEVLFKEGDIGRALFIMESGQVEIFRVNAVGLTQRVTLVGPGDYFGEMSLLDDHPRTAGARALGPCRVYLLYKTELETLLRSAPRIGLAIMSHLAKLLAVRLRLTLNPTETKTPSFVPYVEEAL